MNPNQDSSYYDRLKKDAQSIQDDAEISNQKINPIRAEYEEIKKTPEFQEWRTKQYELQKGHCAYCYRYYPPNRMQVDHVWPICHGGKNSYSNLVLACKHCNEDLKFSSAFNRITYYRAKKILKETPTYKNIGNVPVKMYWQRPKWIPPNKCSDEEIEYNPTVPENKRNVWDLENPIAPFTEVAAIEGRNLERIKNQVSKQKNIVPTANTKIYDKVDAAFNKVGNSEFFNKLGKFFNFVSEHPVFTFNMLLIIVLIIALIIGKLQTPDYNNKPIHRSETSCGEGASLLCYDDECHCVQTDDFSLDDYDY